MGVIAAFRKVLTIWQIYHTWIHSLHCSPLPPSLIPGIVIAGIIFALTYMYINFLHYIHSPTSFPSTSCAPCPRRSCSVLMYSYFVEGKKKKMTFLVV
jgi:hypothetical protein